jgi:TonB-linked SusC/RagA family outer membrane protein
MKLIQPFLTAAVVMLLAFAANAQEIKISGVITDEKDGMPMIGVSVAVTGTTKGTITDLDGNYQISVAPDATQLTFTYVGYNTQVIDIKGQTVINVVMSEDVDVLNEVVVVGYGTQRKSDLTGAVSSVRGADLIKIPNASAEQALQGKVAGVQVSSSSGAPGSVPVIRVRGVGTFNNSSPIFVVDGLILDNISFLNAADIASMEVLKDASATAIYGSRGANGVIIVTTKLGTISGGKPVYSFSAEYGIQHLSKKIDLLEAKEFGAYVNEIIAGSYNNLDALENTDWQDLIFNDAPLGNYQFSVSGASERQQYYVGVGLFTQKGIIEKSDYSRLTIKLNNTYKLSDRIKIGNNITIAPSQQQNAPGVTYSAYRAQPVIQPYNEDGTYAEVPGVGNPLADIEYSNNTAKNVRAVGNVFGELTLAEGLVFRSSFGMDFSYNEGRTFAPVFYVSPQQVNEINDLSISNRRNSNWLWENTLNYNFNLGENHRFDVVGGYTMQQLRSLLF